MASLVLETAYPEDLDCVIIPQEGKELNGSVNVFPIQLQVDTLQPYNVTLKVEVSRFDNRPYIGVKMDDNLLRWMKKLDCLIQGRLQKVFPNHEYQSFLKDGSSTVFFKLRKHPTCLDEEIIHRSITRVCGYRGLDEKWNNQCLEAFLHFDFPVVYTRDGIVGCPPRLLKLSYHDIQNLYSSSI